MNQNIKDDVRCNNRLIKITFTNRSLLINLLFNGADRFPISTQRNIEQEFGIFFADFQKEKENKN